MLKTYRLSSAAAGRFGFACMLMAIAAIPGVSQETISPERPESTAESPAPSGSPSLLNEIGKLLKTPADLLPSASKPEATPKSDAAPEQVPTPAPTAAAPVAPAAEPPPSAMQRLLPGMVSGREICPRVSNGAPDCQAGADKLCQGKGYKGGKSLNTDSAFSCSARIARATGRACGTENFVTSAFCN